MPFVVRKIDYAKWDQRNILKGEQPSADAITLCMKTKQNKLSVWSIDDECEREEAVLAMAANFEHLDTADFVLIDLSLIKGKNLFFESKHGKTPYIKFKDKHRNIIKLDYLSLGVMAEVTVESIRQKRYKRFYERELIEILTNAVRLGKVQWSELKPDVQKKIPPTTGVGAI